MIPYKGINYLTRDINMSGQKGWKEDGYESVTVAPVSLYTAMCHHDKWGVEENSIDDQLAGYVDDDVWEKDLSDEELAAWINEYLYV